MCERGRYRFPGGPRLAIAAWAAVLLVVAAQPLLTDRRPGVYPRA